MSEEAGSLSKDKIRFRKQKPTVFTCENYSRRLSINLFEVVKPHFLCGEEIKSPSHWADSLDHYEKVEDLLADAGQSIGQHDRLYRSGNARRRHTLIGCHRHPGGVPAHHYAFFSHRKHADYSRHLSKSQPSKHH